MIETSTFQDSFLAWSANLLIGANGSWLNVPDQHYGNSVTLGRLIVLVIGCALLSRGMLVLCPGNKQLRSSVFDLSDLCQRTNITVPGEDATNPSDVEMRPRRRMPNGDSTANVGDLMKMESQGQLIVRVVGEMDKVGIGYVRTHGKHSKKSELNEVIASDKMT
ncbi:hypothetical protein Acr_17g0010200 [Actinidia rufa]|uniref:Uncharacterized protein n=1 Tax=Actinidia rufa TaxID=165716 RepID=A0A7J0G3V7_9ERIC|nr:hypothetical protein Acr_17g0010200 [Actinidia rufa]